MSTRTMAPPRARTAAKAPVRRPGPATRRAPRREAARPRPGVDPRIAERRVTVTREAGRRRLRRLVVACVLLLVTGAAGGAVFSPLLDVDRFDVRGADDRVAEVIAASGIEQGAPILLTDIGGAEARIAALPWVGAVRVERGLPGTIRIVVSASVPVAWAYVVDGSVVYLDARGRTQVAGAPVGDPAASGLPEIVVTPEDLTAQEPTPRQDGSGAHLTPPGAARVAASLGPLAGRVAAITVTNGVAVLRLGAGPEVRFGSLTRLAEKARAAAAVLGSSGIEEASYLDVSVPGAPVTG